MYFNGGNKGPSFERNGEDYVIDGNGGAARPIGLKVASKINGNMVPDFYSVSSDQKKPQTITPENQVSISPTSKVDNGDAVLKSTSFDGCLGFPLLTAPDLQQFLMTSDSLDADIAALAHSSEERPVVINRSSSLNNLPSYVHMDPTATVAAVSGIFNPNSFIMNSSIVGNRYPGGGEHSRAMDLTELNTMSIGCLSRLDSLDMNIGTFSHAVPGDITHWVENGTSQMNDDGEMRSSLDDFYSVQGGNGGPGLEGSQLNSLTSSPRGARPPSTLLEDAAGGDRGQCPTRDTRSESAANSMFMDFFQPQPPAPPGITPLNSADLGVFPLTTAQLASQLSLLASLPSSDSNSSTDPCGSSSGAGGADHRLEHVVGPYHLVAPIQAVVPKGARGAVVRGASNFAKKKKFTSSSSSDRGSDVESKASSQTTSLGSVLEQGIQMGLSQGGLNMSSIFNIDHHTGLESLSCMSIDDSTFPLGSASEALKVSSSDWNDPWERQGVATSQGMTSSGLMGLGMGPPNGTFQAGHPVVVGTMDDFGDNDEFMQFSFHSASLDILENTYPNTVSHYPSMGSGGVQDPTAVAENADMTFEQLQLFQHQQLKGGGALPPLMPRESPPMVPGMGGRQQLSNAASRTMKPGFKYANKQPVVKKDGGANNSVIPPVSPSNDPKRVRLFKKKSPAPSHPPTTSFSSAVGPAVGVGSSSSSSSGHPLVAASAAADSKTSGGISDTVFHGFRRRSKLSEAELEDQRAIEQERNDRFGHSLKDGVRVGIEAQPPSIAHTGGDGGLLVARGRYKCGRCGQLKTNHVCEYYEDTSVCSTATQIAAEIIDPTTALPWEGERFIIVGTKRPAAQLQAGREGGSGREGLGPAESGAGAAAVESAAVATGTTSDGAIISGADSEDKIAYTDSSSSSGAGGSSAEGVPGGILLNSGKRIGMGLKLGLVHFAEDVEDEDWRMSVQNSARKGTISDSPFDSIFQLRQALNPTFPVDFDSNTTTPSSSTPYIPTASTPYIPINAEEVMSVLNALEEKAEDSDGEQEEDHSRHAQFTNSTTVSITTSGLCSPIGTAHPADTVSEQSLRASLASRSGRSRRAS